MRHIVLFTRRHCPLCDEVGAQLDSLGVSYVTRDVLADVGLRQEFGDRVPVLAVDGEEVFEGGTSPAEIAEIMREAGIQTGL